MSYVGWALPTGAFDGDRFNWRPYRFFWYSFDRTEPPHVHVERDEDTAKFWLDPVRLERNNRFPKKELNVILAIVVAHREEWLERWRREFGN
jgi:hypothetical protein